MAATQQSLFDTKPQQWEVDDAATALVATIVLSDGPTGEFDYLVPEDMIGGKGPKHVLEPGRRVRVPLGRSNRSVVGYCVDVAQKPTGSRKLKEVASLLDRGPLLSPAMLRVTRWMAEYYLCPWGHVLEAVVPAGVRHDAGGRDVTFLSAAPDAAERAAELKLSAKQTELLRLLATADRPMTAKELITRAGCTTAPLTTLRKKGLVVAKVERLGSEQIDYVRHKRQAPLELNADQVAAHAAIRDALHAAEHRTILIHGVTGSGKTEVYIQAIEEVVRFGRQAILLVPEISLTPQTVARFRARFDRVAVLHSHLTDVERHEHWRRIAKGDVEVIVGARSAIFAPTPNLGLIVLDEEHESTFKQETAPRYHARDVAIRRATDQSVPLVLASATPSMESWQRAQRGEFQLVDMPRRVLNLPLPAVRTIDLRNELHSKTSRGAISRPLHRAMEEALRDGGQVILLLNRRGHSTHIQCPACGHSVVCPQCDLSLTFHRHDNTAVCHYCDFQTVAPNACSECDFKGIRFSGLGTQKLEAEVRARFPNYPCVRMDTDSMRGRGSHEEALSAFRDGRHRILVGTQMIAKGLDFPNVTLVGVINADTALHLPDFRAAERTFQLVTQVAGRTGRGDRPGRALVQTYTPEHPAIQAAVRHDYHAFVASELPERERFGVPPFGRLVRLIARGPDESAVFAYLKEMAEALRRAAEPSVRALGPAPAPILKIRNLYRFHIQLRCPGPRPLQALARAVPPTIPAPHGVELAIDVDPIHML